MGQRVLPHTANGLYKPLKIGDLQLEHRIVYAPLTRCRALGGVPQPAAAEYYSQRATKGGFLLTEATVVSERGYGYPDTPGIHTDEQVEAWKPVVEAVHRKGGVFFLQLWHVGRASLNEFQPGNEPPVAPSAIAIEHGQCLNSNFEQVPYSTPRALRLEEIPTLVEEFVHGARNAIRAGFDGVEIHGANGYILDQFLKSGSNKRMDEYGGSIPNRCRLGLEVAKAVSDAVGKHRVGIRISPFEQFNECLDDNTHALNTHYCAELGKLGLAYVHAIEAREFDTPRNDSSFPAHEDLSPFREAFKGAAGQGAFLTAGGYKRSTAIEAVERGHSDAVVFGRTFLANPDLPERFLLPDVPLNKGGRESYYIPDQRKGYTDYPYLKEANPEAYEKVEAERQRLLAAEANGR